MFATQPIWDWFVGFRWDASQKEGEQWMAYSKTAHPPTRMFRKSSPESFCNWHLEDTSREVEAAFRANLGNRDNFVAQGQEKDRRHFTGSTRVWSRSTLTRQLTTILLGLLNTQKLSGKGTNTLGCNDLLVGMIVLLWRLWRPGEVVLEGCRHAFCVACLDRYQYQSNCPFDGLSMQSLQGGLFQCPTCHWIPRLSSTISKCLLHGPTPILLTSRRSSVFWRELDLFL